MTYNLFDVASQVLADTYETMLADGYYIDTDEVKKRLLALDLDPKRAYLKLSNMLSLFSGNGRVE